MVNVRKYGLAPTSRHIVTLGIASGLILTPTLLHADPDRPTRRTGRNTVSAVIATGIAAVALGQAHGLKSPESSSASEKSPPHPSVTCNTPNKAEIGQQFLVDVSLDDEEDSSSQANSRGARGTSITMDDNDRISFSPSRFTLIPGQHRLVKTKIQSTSSGLASIFAFADDNHTMCDQTVDAGFVGHLEAAPLTLQWHERKPLSIQITDGSGKPLRNATGLLLRLQSADALMHDPETSPQESKKQSSQSKKDSVGKAGKEENPHLVLRDLDAGKIYSDPVSIETDRLTGGSVHVLATLSLGNNVVAQNMLTLDVAPPEWLTCLVAITGALLYSLYNVALGKARVDSLGLAIFAGVIAWLFANFDLLGLKLDPHNLRTYAILGFLFSFVGIDVLLSKRFRPKDFTPRDQHADAPPPDHVP